MTVATDFEHSPEASEGLISFARGSDMMLYDAQYTPDEYEQCRLEAEGCKNISFAREGFKTVI